MPRKEKLHRKFLAEQKKMSGATINDLDDVMVGTDQTFKKKKKDMHIQSMARLGLQTSEYFFFFI